MQINNNTLFQYPGWAPISSWRLPGDLLANLVDTQYIHTIEAILQAVTSGYLSSSCLPGLQPVCPCWHLTLTRHFSSTQLDIFSFLDHCLQTPEIVMCGKSPVNQCLSVQYTHQSNHHAKVPEFLHFSTSIHEHFTWLRGQWLEKKRGMLAWDMLFTWKINQWTK